MDVIQAIDSKIGEVRTESIDMSIGEIIGLHQQKELVIQPDFQRLFRWTFQQRSRLVESLLLELPIPSIFVIERASGVFELIDGLQRVSSLLHFVDVSSLNASSKENVAEAELDNELGDGEQLEELAPLRLTGCDLVTELNDLTFEELPLTVRLRLKRTPIRVVVIKRQSSQFLRYEMFKRLNTGGSKLSDQDIRNVNARMLGESGSEFYAKIKQCSIDANFRVTTELLPSTAVENRLNEELVLRFFATMELRGQYKGNVGDWLDDYMEDVLIHKRPFGMAQIDLFKRIFALLAEKFGQHAFVKYKNGVPSGGVAPAYFEAVCAGAFNSFEKLQALSPADAKILLAKTVESAEFRQVTGPGANSLPKLEERIRLIGKAFAEA